MTTKRDGGGGAGGGGDDANAQVRIGEAAAMLGVSVESLRRWERDGRLRIVRTSSGQRLVPLVEVRRLLDDRRRAGPDRPIVAQSARNRFPGVITRVEKDKVAA